MTKATRRTVKWAVSLLMDGGMVYQATVIALNKPDAEYRAARIAEHETNRGVERVLRVLPQA